MVWSAYWSETSALKGCIWYKCPRSFECDSHISFVAFPASVPVIYQILFAAEIIVSLWSHRASQINKQGTLLDQWLLFCLWLEVRPPGVLREWLGNTLYRNKHTHTNTHRHTHHGPALSNHFLHSNQPIVGFGWYSARLNKHCENV